MQQTYSSTTKFLPDQNTFTMGQVSNFITQQTIGDYPEMERVRNRLKTLDPSLKVVVSSLKSKNNDKVLFADGNMRGQQVTVDGMKVNLHVNDRIQLFNSSTQSSVAENKKRLTESQLRQVIREELVGLLNEISPFEKGPYGVGVKRTPEELKADFVPQWSYDPNSPVVDPRFRSEPMDVLESYQAFSFFNKLEKPFYELKKIFQIDDKNNFEVSFIRSLNLLKIDYDSNIAYNKRRKDEYNQKAKLLIIQENGKLYLAVPDPEVDDEFRKIQIKQKQFDIIKQLLQAS